MKATEYFCGEEIAANVWDEKYALRDKEDKQTEDNPDQMHWRIARELARVEQAKFKEPYSEEFIYSLLKDFGPIIPQGSPMYGIGNTQLVTLSNCYVVDPPLDSYGGIHHTDEQLTQICKRRGGVGTDVSHIRPDDMPTTNAARKATGVVSFCERFSNSIREVAQKGRRGALMLTLCSHHPQVVDFSRMKFDPTKVTGANVSVRLSDEFLGAVDADAEYEQRWPVDSNKPIISRKVKARAVWASIIDAAWQRAEPGLLFWDHIIRESPADCYAKFGFRTVATNPCSELPLCVLDSCRLLLLNLFCFVENPFRSGAFFDFKKFCEYAQIAQRLMDDIVDLEIEAIDRIIAKVKTDQEPAHVKARELELWQRIREKCISGRRTGTGITALGDAMATIGIRYGTDESIEFTEKVYRALKLSCYRASVNMAQELGAFPVFDPELEKDCPFLLRIKEEDAQLYEDMQRYGRRNIALLTTAPAGSVSILAGPRPYFGTTSGIEPLFTDEPFIRRKKIVHGMVGARVDSTDQMGDSWTHFEVFHPKLKMWLDVTGETDWKMSPYHGCCANDIDWKQRVKLQAAAQRHVDHAISSTINLPKEVSREKVAEIYETAWKAGCKGITVYRDGCRDGVLVKETAAAPSINTTDAPKRPKELPCDIYHMRVKGEPFVVVIGLLKEQPYEVFAFTNKLVRVGVIGDGSDGPLLAKTVSSGKVRKAKRGQYELWDVSCEEDLLPNTSLSSLLSDTEEALTRMTSTALRHGAQIEFVVQQLSKVQGDLHSFAKVLARALKLYVPDGKPITGSVCEGCGSESLIFQEGCHRCTSCGWSKCN